jgi:succinate dehydrogenase hydrophobic anchor subunit
MRSFMPAATFPSPAFTIREFFHLHFSLVEPTLLYSGSQHSFRGRQAVCPQYSECAHDRKAVNSGMLFAYSVLRHALVLACISEIRIEFMIPEIPELS